MIVRRSSVAAALCRDLPLEKPDRLVNPSFVPEFEGDLLRIGFRHRQCATADNCVVIAGNRIRIAFTARVPEHCTLFGHRTRLRGSRKIASASPMAGLPAAGS